MFQYPDSFESAKAQLQQRLSLLQKQGYEIIQKRIVINKYYFDKITIAKPSRILNKIVLSSGIHGIEGYIGHVCQMYFIDHILPKMKKETTLVLFHIINPHGFIHYRRFNENNVDLNRNYSKNHFTSKNLDFFKLHNILSPRSHSNKVASNIWFYYNVTKSIMKHSYPVLFNAVLKGQKVDQQSIYYSGNNYETSTIELLNELDSIYKYTDSVLWIDLHSGYGKKDEMLVINSRYEVDETKKLLNNVDYKHILGVSKDAIYDTDGDITEKLYQVHQSKNYTSELLALCFEFGTTSTRFSSSLFSLKSLLFENSSQFMNTSASMKKYNQKNMEKLFMPNNIKWKSNAISNFEEATLKIMQYKKLI